MVETLTESFCERCGTRYEFQAPTRLNPLRKTRGLFGGLKNYLTSQDDFGDAMGDAMRSEEEQLASAQLEAFHESFNFCINCRQYTCVNCWNDEDGRCRSCAPIAGTDDLSERIAASVADDHVHADAPELTMAEADIQRRLGLEAWPTTDAAPATSNGHAPGAWPSADELVPAAAAAELVSEAQTEIVVEPEPVLAEGDVEPEPIAAEADVEPDPIAAEVEPEPVAAEVEPEPLVAEVEPEPLVAEAEPEPVLAEAEIEPEARVLRVVSWDEDAAYEVAPPVRDLEPEPEPIVAEFEPEPVLDEPEPVVAEVDPQPEPEPLVAEVEPQPEPVVADVEPEPPAGPRIAPISETILRFPTQPAPAPQPRAPEGPAAEPVAAQDDTPELAARRAQLDLLGLGDPGDSPVSDRPNVLPYRSRGASPTRVELAALSASGFWEASAREVAGAAAHIGVQSCDHCGLSLSATARFCRRCGSRQAQPA